jgi:hypothetical protein
VQWQRMLCPLCGGQMRIIAFITHSVDIRQISGKYGSPSGWRQSHRASPRHACRRCVGPVRRWARASTLSQIVPRRPNRRRALRSISASVGKA